MKKQHIKTLIIGVAIVFLFGLIVFTLEVAQEKNRLSEQIILPSESDLVQKDASSKSVEGNSMEIIIEGESKIYKNKEYNFEFKLPKELTVTPTSSSGNIGINRNEGGHWIYGIKINENLNQLSLDQILEQTLVEPQFKGKKVIVNDVIIGGFQAKRYQNTEFRDYGNAGVLVLVGNNIFTIFGDDSLNQYKKDFEIFLKSFKFN